MINGTQVTTGKVRLSYVYIFTPKPNDDPNAPAKYGVCLLIPKSDTQTMNEIRQACETARKDSAGKFNGKVPTSLPLPYHDGDKEKPNGGEYGPECKGMWVMNASTNKKVPVVDRHKQPITDSTELYSGCWGRAAINLGAYNSHGNRGIACYINALQKVADDDPLGSSVDVNAAFSALDDDDEDLGL